MVRKAVATAMRDLLTAGKLDFTVIEVAELSGVGRRTIHRRWPGRHALIREGLGEHNTQFKVSYVGELEEDLYRFAVAFRDFSDDPREIAINSLLVTGDEEFRNELMADWGTRVLQPNTDYMRRDEKTGEIRHKGDAKQAMSMLSSTILTFTWLLRQPPTNRALRQMVAGLVRMCRG